MIIDVTDLVRRSSHQFQGRFEEDVYFESDEVKVAFRFSVGTAEKLNVGKKYRIIIEEVK